MKETDSPIGHFDNSSLHKIKENNIEEKQKSKRETDLPIGHFDSILLYNNDPWSKVETPASIINDYLYYKISPVQFQDYLMQFSPI